MSLHPDRLAVAQMGPNNRADSRAQIVERHIALMEEAASAGAGFVLFPELSLTTFFPRWLIEDEAELDSFYEAEMPNDGVATLFSRGRELGIGFSFGYAELAEEAGARHRYNTSILVDGQGRIAGKYRKVHLPGHSEPQPRTFQHLEKRYFEPGNLGFPTFPSMGRTFGICICNDRRWPETHRSLRLNGADTIIVGYNTPTDHTGHASVDALSLFHNQLSLQAAAYQNSVWVLGAAKCGVEDGSFMLGQSMIVAPSGEIVAQARSVADEVIVATCPVAETVPYRETIFSFEKHRRPECYGAITAPR
ncbi:N-carbamoyl-D-amino-acid hydrolase [Frigidibacter sp. MR17.24]|uniref:N-carbamoyl-D-amino-acid hydrolase n=1 Tax=Frigidibacter sp. MR17.24 TaxID=3127345 RepID=UPI00301305DE